MEAAAIVAVDWVPVTDCGLKVTLNPAGVLTEVSDTAPVKGAVRLMPQLALNPLLWAVPLATGLAIIIYYKFDLAKKSRPTLYMAEPAARA